MSCAECIAQPLLQRILEELEALRREQAAQREDTRVIRTELKEQHEHLLGLFDRDKTPPMGIRFDHPD